MYELDVDVKVVVIGPLDEVTTLVPVTVLNPELLDEDVLLTVSSPVEEDIDEVTDV